MRSKLLVIWLMVLILMPSLIFSDTTGKINGVVKDSQSGTPLPGVNVIIDGTTMGASTNLEGYYFVIGVPPGTYSVRAQMIGYQTLVKKEVLARVGLTTEINFDLSQTVLDLGEAVEVVAERPIVQKDITSGRAIVTREEIKEMPVESFTGVLKTKVGIVSGADGSLHIRGGRAGEIAYMIDGISVTNPFWGGLAVSVENTAIQELQVVSGTFNAEYGKAMSGVVNIVTREGGSDFHGNFSAYLGDRFSANDDVFMNIDKIDMLNTQNLDVSLSGPVPGLRNKLSFFASARFFNDQGYLYGKREHTPMDAIYVDSTSALNLVHSPYNTEPYQDLNLNNQYDSDEPYFDRNGNNQWDIGRINFIEPFTDSNRNGQYDLGEPFIDYNLDGNRDNGFSGDGKMVSMNSYRKLSTHTKLTYRPMPGMNIRYSLLFDKSVDKDYSHLYKYNPDGIPQQHSWSLNNMLDFTHQLSPSTFYTVKFSYYKNDYKNYLYKDWQDPRYLPNLLSNTPGNEFYGGGMSRSHSYQKFSSTNGRFDISSQVTKAQFIKAGLEFKHHNLFYYNYSVDIRDTYDWIPTIHDMTSTSNNRYRRYPIEFAAYIQDKIELRDMVVNLGLRYDYFNSRWKIVADNRDKLLISGVRETLDDLELVDAEAKHQVSPRLGIAYPITERGIIHFSYGHFFQIPNFAYLYSNPEFEIVSGRFNSVLGNANLKTENTVTYEIGLQQQVAVDIGIEIIAFYKDINDLLGTEYFELYSRGDYYSRYTNVDYGNTRGITFALEKRRSGYISASLDYTFSVAEGNSSDPLSKFYDLQTFPPTESERRVVPLNWDQTHTLNFSITVSKPRDWGISFLGKLGSGLPYTPAKDDLRIDAENSARKPVQLTFDLHAHKDFKFGKNAVATVFIKAYNLLDRLNEIYVYDDTGRATYALYPRTDYGDEFGRHYLKDYLNRPTYYSSPRVIYFGGSFEF
ncbi:TonB-dependent receptor [candidate division KSB1 bacterium]|nr:TonB-dependent receptor [candidate division KSB1 bacterium]